MFSDTLKKLSIPLYVFITGACVLIIEIAAIRVLSPYYGNTIFAVSAVISVVLLALSIGYYYGGKFADQRPEESIFFKIIATSGFAVIFLHLAGIVFLSNFGYQLSIMDGPVISALLLFFGQSFLLGMLSPFAIKLQQKRFPETGIGQVSGQVFFWSTLGSIAGSLSAGFLLIPHFGVDTIILGTGFLLVILGLFGNFSIKPAQKFLLITVLVIASFFFVSGFSLQIENAVYQKDGLYQRITIFDGEYNGAPARFLLQDKNTSAAKFLQSDELVFEYTKYYKLYEIFTPNPAQVLAIGAGAYSIPQALLNDLPNATIEVAEIEPGLFDLSKKYFGIQDNPRLHNITKDGRRMLHDSQKKYDFIFSDAYASLYSTPQHLTTQEFFTLAKEKMSENGLFVANVIGSIEPKPHSFALSEMKTFKSVFENSYFFATRSPNSPETQNLIFVGYNSDKIIDFNAPSIKNSQNPIISGLQEKLIDVNAIDFSQQYLLTDNFSPVDYLISKEFDTLN